MGQPLDSQRLVMKLTTRGDKECIVRVHFAMWLSSMKSLAKESETCKKETDKSRAKSTCKQARIIASDSNVPLSFRTSYYALIPL